MTPTAHLTTLCMFAAIGCLAGVLIERNHWLAKPPQCVDLKVIGGRFELKSEGTHVLFYGN